MNSPTEDFQQACALMAQAKLEPATLLFLKVLQSPQARVPGRFFINLESYLEQALTSTGPPGSWNLNLHLASHLNLARIYWQQEQTEQALQHLNNILSQSPSAEIYHLQARWLVRLGRSPEAILSLGQAILLDSVYLSAYEDLATIANQNEDPDLAYQIIQKAMVHRLTPRLLEELILASSKEEYVSMRSLFLELCVQHITPDTHELLLPLLQNLYAEEDFHHSEYLGFHLLQVFRHSPDILDVYVLSALRQKHFAPALQALINVPDAVLERGEYWFKLGIVYAQWNMPLFALFSLRKALKLGPHLDLEIRPQLRALPIERTLEQTLTEIIRQALVSPVFRDKIKTNTSDALKSWSIPTTPELLQALKKIFPNKKETYTAETDMLS